MMTEIENLDKDIEKLRDNLNTLIKQKGKLQDPEVITASRLLNAAIVEYNRIVESKIEPE